LLEVAVWVFEARYERLGASGWLSWASVVADTSALSVTASPSERQCTCVWIWWTILLTTTTSFYEEFR
jgi:hypothetical protein